MPRSASAFIACQKICRFSTSMPVVGSSSTIRSLSPAIAMAKRTRWVCPPDSLSAFWSANSSMFARLSSSSTGVGLGWIFVMNVSSSRTVTSLSSPPDWSIAPTWPETMA